MLLPDTSFSNELRPFVESSAQEIRVIIDRGKASRLQCSCLIVLAAAIQYTPPKRPWTGQQESVPQATLPPRIPNFSCARATRASRRSAIGISAAPMSFTNDLPALMSDTPPRPEQRTILDAQPSAAASCRVTVSLRSQKEPCPTTLPALEQVVAAGGRKPRSAGKPLPLGAIFENKGAAMGLLQPAPHGQVWANSSANDGRT
ncbi:hypothetical protein CU560_26340 [Serratia ureilytica]|nr:hypothetical protein CU560_26340 [Serratia ureilytica]